MTFLKKIAPFLIKGTIAAAIIAALIYANSDGKLLACFKQIHPGWVAAAAVFYALHIFANAWRWHLLLRVRDIDCSLPEAVSLTMQSFFFSLVIPGGAIGGDLVRVTFLTRRVPKGRKLDGAVTILMDRFTGMIGIFTLALCLLPFCLNVLDTASWYIQALILFLIFGSIAGLCAALFVFGHRYLERFALFRAFCKLSDKLSRGLFSKMIEAIDDYQDCRKELIICILSSIVFVNINLGIVGFCLCRGLDPAWFVPLSALSAITIGNIAGLLPLTPSGVGVRDIVIIPILTASGMSSDMAVAVSLSLTAMILAFNLLGGLFFLFSAHKKAE